MANTKDPKDTKIKAAAKKPAGKQTENKTAAKKPVGSKLQAENKASAKKPIADKVQAAKDKVSLFSKPVRLTIFFTGIALAVAAVFLIGYITGSLVSADNLVTSSLDEIKQNIALAVTPTPPSSATPIPSVVTEPLQPTTQVTPSPTPKPTINAPEQPKGGVLGYLVFDSILDDGIPREVPIIEGTDKDLLNKGAGHYINFAYPGEIGNVALFGHRTTVFKNFDLLSIGDRVQVVTQYGTFNYYIIDMQIAEPMAPLMFEVYDTPMMTLVTCYPFIYAGHAPQRYIVVLSLDEGGIELSETEQGVPAYTLPPDVTGGGDNPRETADPLPS